jgi:hypothetical protein
MMSKKKEVVNEIAQASEEVVCADISPVSPNDLGWTDHVLELLADDEKIKGNPTTDGLRRVFELALNCTVIKSISNIAQSPSPDNEKRATVVHSLTYILNNMLELPDDSPVKYRTVSGSADVYWGNCDKIYRNHPVAVAETRAEGRALRRALKLRKVIAAEEMVEDIEDHPDANSVNKITNNQINFIDVIGQRLNINIKKLLTLNGLDVSNVYSLQHENAVDIIRLLSRYQQNISEIPSEILEYSNEWK